MDASGYVTLARQSGLMSQMATIAHNMANISTAGFRREGMVFSEYIQQVPDGPSISMAYGNGREIDLTQGDLEKTGGRFDFALQGEGFFQVQTPQGTMLTRAGAFTPSLTGELVNPDGHKLLDENGAPIFVPPNATDVKLARDGTLSANGKPLARVGIVTPLNRDSLNHKMGTLFSAGATQPVDHPTVLQGYLEGSNVDPISEVARMVSVQRAYEMGQNFLQQEDQRMKSVIDTLGR